LQFALLWPPFAIDVDQDGNAEIFVGNCIYSSTPPCALLWCGSFGGASVSSAVANMDSDPEGEVVMCGVGQVQVYEHNGAFKWSYTLPNIAINSGGGPPALGDFNGDGFADVGVSNFNSYFVIDGNTGTLLTSFSTVDNSDRTSSSAFDFDDDGITEFVFMSSNLYIISASGNILFVANSLTGSEYPVIADIDLDGQADIVASGSAFRVFNSYDTWAGADYFWSFHGFNSLNLDQQHYPKVASVSQQFHSTPTSRFVPMINDSNASAHGTQIECELKFYQPRCNHVLS